MFQVAIYKKGKRDLLMVLPFLSIEVGRVFAKGQEGDECSNIPLPWVFPGMASLSCLTEKSVQ